MAAEWVTAGSTRHAVMPEPNIAASRKQWLDFFESFSRILLQDENFSHPRDAKIQMAAELSDVALDCIENRWPSAAMEKAR